jgi:hypothetical protein
VHGDASVGTISSTSILIPEDFEELTHILIAVDISKEIQEKQAGWVITRRAVRGISVCDQRPNKGEVDQGGYHPGVATPDSAIGKDLNELFFKAIVGKERQIRERPSVGERNFQVDFVEFFANVIYGEFLEKVHQTPHGSGRSCLFCLDYSPNFFLKSFLKG